MKAVVFVGLCAAAWVLVWLMWQVFKTVYLLAQVVS